MKNKIKSILVVSLLVIAGFVMIWNFGNENVNVQGLIRYVGNDSTYKTIQAAIDNATSGDTIYVKNDTYYESVLLNKSNIELIGNSTTDCKIIHYYNGSSTSDFAAGINITADDVNVTGFNISVSGNYTFGFYLSGCSNVRIDDNNITTTGPNHAYGIILKLSWDNIIKNNNINTSGDNCWGIYLWAWLSENNKVINNNISTSGQSAYGIYLFMSGEKNNLTDNTINTTGYGGVGILLAEFCWYNNLTDNTINTSGDSAEGIVVGNNCHYTNVIDNIINTSGSTGNGIALSNSNKCNLPGNTINTSGQNGYGISLGNSNNNNITGNTINTSGDGGYGIYLGASHDNNLTGNTINNSGTDADGMYISSLSSDNNITGNTIEILASADGISILSGCNNNDVIDNTINLSGGGGSAIYSVMSSGHDIFDNTINCQMYNNARGIYLHTNSNDINVINNTITTKGDNGHAIFIQDSSNIEVQDNTINTSGDAFAIYLNPCINANITANTITTTGLDGYGINLRQSTNCNLVDNTINTTGSSSFGIFLQDNSNDNNLTDNTINTSGSGSVGIEIYSYCVGNNITDNTIYIPVDNGLGIYLEAWSDNNDLIDNTINTTGDSAYGIGVDSSSLYNNLIGNTIDTSGQSGHGIWVATGSHHNEMIDNTINTTGFIAYGIYLQTTSYNNLTANTINTSGLNGYGIVIESSTNNNLTGNTINTSGDVGYGIYQVSDSNYNDLIDNTIYTTGANGKGIYLFGNSKYNNLIDNTINTTGDDGIGIYLQISSSNNNLTGNTINTSGDDSYGIYLFQSTSSNNLTDNTINTFGVDGYGIYISLDSHYNNLTNNVIVTTNVSGHGIMISNSNNTSLLDCQVSAVGTSARGIYLIGLVATIIDSVIDSSSFIDMYVMTDGNLTAINCSFNDVDVQSGGGGVLQVKYYLSVQAYYEGGTTPIQNADIVVEDNGVSVYNSSGYGGTDPQTAANGRVENIIVTDRWYFYSNTATENDTTIKVTKSVDATWEEMRPNVDMSTTHTETFIATDIFKPVIPVNLSATSVVGGDAINISWNVSLDDTVKYELWWLDPNLGWVIIANITHPTNWLIWQNDSLVNGTKYYFKLRAWDDVDIGSEYTEVNLTHIDELAPEAPTNLTAETLSDTTIQLTWNLSGDLDLAGSWVYMNVTGSGIIGPYYRIAVVNLPTSTYIATGLVENETYYFLVKSIDEATNPSTGSNIAQNTTLNIAPSAPSLDSLPPLTNNPKLNVTGTTEPKIDAEIYNNGALAGSGSANVTGAFKIEITLEEGQNAITAKAIDKANNPSGFTTPAIDVTLDTVAPVVSLDEFAEYYTKNDELDVTGSTENDSIVYVYDNDNLAAIANANSTGQFDIQITLVENENIIHANALDPAKNNGSNSTAQSIILDLENPVANAGADLNITVGDTANFDGSDSTDNWGITNYTWSFEVNATPTKLYNEMATYQFNTAGIYNVILTVTDRVGNMDTDILTVEVNPAVLPDTEPPIADAGPDQTVEEGTEVTLDGASSTDNDVIINYTWTFIYEGNLITLYNENTTFVFAKAGNYNVTLTVIDFAKPPNIGTDNLWVTVTAELDSDDDGYPDNIDAFPNDPNEWEDTDSDGTGDNADTDDDEDGYLDEWEDSLGTDPKDATSIPPDYDGDGAPDGDATNSMPWMDNDDDDDGMADWWEENYGLDPKDPSDANEDTDGDGLTNLEEYREDTDPLDPNDGGGTPIEPNDTDGDGLPDEWEMKYFDDLSQNGNGDYDNDNYTNKEEYDAGSIPTNSASMPLGTDKEASDEIPIFIWIAIIIVFIIIIVIILILRFMKKKPSSDQFASPPQQLSQPPPQYPQSQQSQYPDYTNQPQVQVPPQTPGAYPQAQAAYYQPPQQPQTTLEDQKSCPICYGERQYILSQQKWFCPRCQQ
ncbi:MAG: right-handed parallel beta-helix repeat-containing protein [Thermoplasmata archaeon]|nr:right-handed parallel beta-helix repeat-containing protein [Thermoplasmata archaeon]